MKNYADADYIHARIAAMRSRLLAGRDYAVLVREQMSASASAPGNTLLDREALFREQIAPVIAIAGAYAPYTPLFVAFLRLYEVQNVKILLAKAADMMPPEQWYDIAPHAIVEKELLQKKLTGEDLRSLFAGTYLASCFAGAFAPRRMAIRLDLCAAANLYNAACLLDGQAQREFQDVALKRVAVLTLLWSSRLQTYYSARDEQLASLLEKFQAFFSGPASAQVRLLEEALARYADERQKSTGQKPSPIDIERYLERFFYAWISSMFHRDFHSLYGVAAYLWLLFYQIQNLYRIRDGRRFGLSAEAVLDALCCEA